MYCEYWNLIKPPFDNVPDSSMYVDCHVSMENVISETIFAIKEGNECFAVIVGDVGLGKTLSLRIIIDSLDPEKYKVALITNPALSFIQLLSEIIGQITGKQCEEKKKVNLLEIFNRLLFDTKDQGKKIVIVIDEANVLSDKDLENLRLLTNMQDDQHNLFTLILAGQMELAKKLESPKNANIFQRIGTYGHIEKLPSEEAVKTYVESRLMISGTDKKIFTDEAISEIWRYSEHGTPRLINKICKLCLKAGETNEFNTISNDVVTQIADRFQKLSKAPLQKRKPQISPETEVSKKDISDEPEAENVQERPRRSAPNRAPATHIPPPQRRPMAAEAEQAPQEQAPPSIPQRRPMPVETEAAPREQAPPSTPQRRPMPVEEEAAPREQAPPNKPQRRPMPVEEEAAPWEQAPPSAPQRRPMPVEEEAAPWEQAPPSASQRRPMPVEEEAAPWEQAPPSAPQRRPMPVEAEAAPWEQAPPSAPQRRPMPVEEEAAPWEQAPPSAPQRRPMNVEAEAAPWEQAPPSAPQRRSMPVEEEAPWEQAPPSAPQRRPMNVEAEAAPQKQVSPNLVPLPRGARPVETKAVPPRQAAPTHVPSQQEDAPVETMQSEREVYEEVSIGQYKVKLSIPANIIKQAQSASTESKNKLAGYWSAQIIKENPHLMHSALIDPVAIWYEIKNIVLKKFNSA